MQELGFRQTVQILDHTVVIEDLQLLCGEQHGQKVVEFLAAVVIGMRCAAKFSHFDSGSGTMMPVRNIQCGDRRKACAKCFNNCRIVHDPDLLAHTVRRKVIYGLVRLLPIFQHFRDLRLTAVGQEDRSRVRVERVHMADTVLFLVRARQFMLFDDILQIIVYRRTTDQPRLHPSETGLGIDI